MDSDSKQMEQHPVQCRNGCGFYGNPATEGMCSVCYKDTISKKQMPPMNLNSSTGPTQHSIVASEPSSSTTTSILPVILKEEIKEESENADSLLEGAAAVAIDLQAPELKLEEDRDGKKKKNRCGSCNKKVGLTGFSCRCGGLFCSLHRYSDKHDCSFDYKQMGADEIKKSNPVVIAPKVSKI